MTAGFSGRETWPRTPVRFRPRSSDAGFAPSPLWCCRPAIGTLLTDDDNLVEGPTVTRAVKVLRLALGR